MSFGGLIDSAYVAMAALIVIGAFLGGMGGIGFTMFAAPMAALCVPQLTPGPLLALGSLLSLLTVWREHRLIAWPLATQALIGRFAGTLPAAMSVALLPERLMTFTFAGLILLAVAISLAGWKVQASPRNVMAAGVASGLMGTITSAGGPPFAIVLQNLAPATLRATMGVVLSVGSLMSLIALAVVGRFGTHDLIVSAMLVPPMLLGFAASSLLNRRLPGSAVRALLLGLAAFGAIALLVKLAIAP